MSETWLVTKIWFKERNYEALLLNFVKPTVEELENAKFLETFHFFFEPSPHFLFRVRVKDEETRIKIRPTIEKNLENAKDLIDKHNFDETYTGEHTEYGIEGWKLAQKFFEDCCRIAITRIDNTIQKGLEFNEGKFIHCFLNQLGFNIPQEACFHFDRSVERALVGYGVIGKLKEIEDRLSALEKREDDQNAK